MFKKKKLKKRGGGGGGGGGGQHLKKKESNMGSCPQVPVVIYANYRPMTDAKRKP